MRIRNTGGGVGCGFAMLIRPRFYYLQFVMPLQEVERRTMWVSVWHSDMFGRNDFLGEVSELSLTPISYFKVKKEVQEIFIIFVHASNINMIHGLKYFCTVLNSRVLCFLVGTAKSDSVRFY